MAHTAHLPSAGIRPLATRTARESAHLLLDLPIGIVGFTFMVCAFATGASLAITLAGIPLLAGTLVLARSAAGLERARARALLGIALAPPPAAASTQTGIARLIAPLRDASAWRASGYFVAMLPAAVATFTAAVTWWATSLFLLTLPLWAWALPGNGPGLGDGTHWSSLTELAASTVAGALLLAATPWVVHALTSVDRALLRLLHHHR